MSCIIAVTCDHREVGPKPNGTRVRPGRPEVYVGESIVEQLRMAGAHPILLPPEPQPHAALFSWILTSCQGLVITGGAFDIHPSHYGDRIKARIDRIDEARTGLELGLAKLAIEKNFPVLGICGGMQALAVAAGGTLIQDINSEVPNSLEHEQPTDPAEPWHTVHLKEGLLYRLEKRDEIQVNSTHHQAVDKPGALTITGRAPDGIVEVVEHADHRFCLGVQWHPELLGSPAFQGLVDAAR